MSARAYVHASEERRAPAPRYLALILSSYAALGLDPEPLERAATASSGAATAR